MKNPILLRNENICEKNKEIIRKFMERQTKDCVDS